MDEENKQACAMIAAYVLGGISLAIFMILLIVLGHSLWAMILS